MKSTFKIIEYRYIGYILTVILFALFITGTVMRGGFNWGIDFMGGIKVIAKFGETVRAGDLRHLLERNNIKAEVQQFGSDDMNEFVISTRLPERGSGAQNPAPVTPVQEGQISDQSLQTQAGGIVGIERVLLAHYPNVHIVSREEVGPAIGDYLKKSAIYLMFWCVVLMMVYLGFRFEFQFAVGALAAILHDVALSFLFCGFVGLEINIPIIAGILTIFGYSVNDTIVVYDRIRENMNNMAKHPFKEICNISISQTLSRTILTTITTLLAVFCLYIIGESVINDFARLLLFGFTLGIFSTIFVAAPVIYEWKKLSEKAD